MPQTISPDIIRTCKCCGKQFHPKSRKQSCCDETVTKTCVICGNTFEGKCNLLDTRTTCSKKCAAALIKRNRQITAAKEVKKCKWCGAVFVPKSSRDVYCNSVHYQTCVVCGSLFEIDPRINAQVKTCSSECKKVLSLQNRDLEQEQAHLKKTLQDRYGVTNPMYIPDIQKKIVETNQQKYGVDWYTQTDEYHARVQDTDLAKYGVSHHLKSTEIKEKRAETVRSTYGVANVFQSDTVKSRIKNTNIIRYGVENPSQAPEIQAKIKETNLNTYGVSHPMMLREFQQKAVKTNLERYGRSAYTQQHIPNIENWYLFLNDPRSYVESNYNTPPRTEELAKDLGVDQSTIDVYLKKTGSTDCVRRAKSLMEEDICNFIQSLNSNIQIVQNDKTQIHPMELDIYLPEYNVAFECNPTVTHNSSTGDPWGGTPKPYNYHYQKTIECRRKNIFLFHIFGYEWSHKRQVILSMIQNILGQSAVKIYARQCEIKEVDHTECEVFLDKNHRQGSSTSSVRLGLYYNGELVSVMTFGKMRHSIGTSADEDLSDCWELVRFCSKINTNVVGAASRLFCHFVKTYRPNRIRSFSDNAHTRGTLYSILGFEYLRESSPGYVWVDTKTDIGYHRYNAQKHVIKKFLHDDMIDLNKTEKQIMEEHKFVQVFDSGTTLWEWKSA